MSSKLDTIDFVIQNKLISLNNPSTIKVQLFKDAWHLNDAVDILFVRKESDIKAKAAWNITKGDPDIIIAVMDDGFALTNSDLKHKITFPADLLVWVPILGIPRQLNQIIEIFY